MYSLQSHALAWMRYAKRMPIVCTEAGRFNSDVLGMNSKMCIEMEIKKTISDLRAEFRNKVHKHYIYNLAAEAKHASGYVPNYFYFFTLEDLGEKALEIIKEKMPRAGLAILKDDACPWNRNAVQVLRRPTKIHDKAPNSALIQAAVMRMSSEICHFHRTAGVEKVAEIQMAVAGIGGTLDFEDVIQDLERKGKEFAYILGDDWNKLNYVDRIRRIFQAQRLASLYRTHEPLGDIQ